MNSSIPHLSVKKFGGTSLADQACIAHVATLIQSAYDKKEPMAVVVSAMAGTTDHLKNLMANHNGCTSPHPERDVILSTGEQVSAALLSMELEKRGVPARSWMGWQIPIVTTDHAECAHITQVETRTILDQITKGIVPIICGFQGINDKGRITTLGRGGSDTTAVALAAHLGASTCQIFTDVHGIYTADPSRIYNAQRYKTISYDDMLILSRNGARVLHPRSVTQAQQSEIPIHVLSTWNHDEDGTYIHSKAPARKGLALKEAVRWLLPYLCEKKIQDIHQKCHFYSIPILHWKMSSLGLSFILWKEHEHMVASMIDTLPESLDMLTVLGFTSDEKDRLLSYCAQSIKQCFSYPKYFILVSEKQHSLDLMNNIHKWISTA